VDGPAPSPDAAKPGGDRGDRSDRSDRRSERLLALGIFALLLASYAYFYQGGGWNENSRMDLVRAIVDDHSFSIDRFHTNTGDKAKFAGHYYSDKAPGLSLFAIPAYALARAVFGSLEEHTFLVVASYMVTVLTVGVGSALLGALLFLTLRKLGATRRGAMIAALGWGLGSIAFPFSTMLFSHQLTALLLFASFVLLFRCREKYSDWLSVAAGVVAAAAVLTEFPALGAVGLLGVYAAERDRRWRRVLTFLAGALGPALVLVVYLTVAFGGPLKVGYGFLADAGSRAEQLDRGIFGVTLPQLGRTVELLIGRYRGLLPYSPVMLLATIGVFSGFAVLRRQRKRAGDASMEIEPVPRIEPQRIRELWLAAGVCIYYVLFVSSYTWWQGGSSFGSRHLVPMLPFLALALGWIADWRPKLSAAALVISVATMTIVTSVQPKPADSIRNPFWGVLVPAFVRGEIAANNICPLYGRTDGPKHRAIVKTATHDAFNLGMALGGRGHKSLLPLIALWIASAYSLWRATGERGEQRSGAAAPVRVDAAPGPS
jgi:hypothetical protein